MSAESDLSSSMKESLEKTFDEIQEREETDIPDKEEPAKVELKSEEPAEETDKSEKEEAAPEAPKVAAKTTDKVAAPVITDKTLVNPPDTWRPAAKAEWSKLPEGIRKEIKKRENDAMTGVTAHKEMADYGKRITQTIDPYRAYLRARGADEVKVVEDALNLSYQLTSSNPQQRGAILARIGKQYGADFSVLTQQPNPEQDRMQQVLSPLQARIEQLEREKQNSDSLTQQQKDQAAEKMVADFTSETDETGQLKHPYYNNVVGLMVPLLESGVVKTLPEAYALACDTHPDTKGLVKPQSQRQKDAKLVDKAKKNDSLNIPKRAASPSAKAPQGSMRETIEAAYERMQNA